MNNYNDLCNVMILSIKSIKYDNIISPHLSVRMARLNPPLLAIITMMKVPVFSNSNDQ